MNRQAKGLNFVYFYNLLDIIFINFSLKLTLYPFSNVLHKIHFNQSYATSGITCRQFLCNCYIRIYNEKCINLTSTSSPCNTKKQ